jgi:hypothetical protein
MCSTSAEMAHTYPEEFIPIGDAFEQAFSAMGDRGELLKGEFSLKEFKDGVSSLTNEIRLSIDIMNMMRQGAE